MQKFIHPLLSDWDALMQRPTASYSELETLVAEVFNKVAREGDTAVATYTAKFDGLELKDFLVSEREVKAATEAVPEELKKAIQQAKGNIERFHQAQKTNSIRLETQKGVRCWQEKRAIEKVGLYIPGGSAPLFSTILMLAIPAQIAGCSEIVMCTPPNAQGKVPEVVLFTAALCGVTKIFKAGGIQAIAAMSLGTESIPSVYKIFGPGNQYVTVAKQWATRYNVAIDMPAGPSELLVAADETADPDFVASDLLSQAEHGPDSQVILVSTQETFVDKIIQAIKSQLLNLPRKDIAEKALNNSKVIVLKDDATAVKFIN